MNKTSHEPVSKAPVFFADNRRRWRIFAGFCTILGLFGGGLAGMATVSLLRESAPAASLRASDPVAFELKDLPKTPAGAQARPLALLFDHRLDERNTPMILDILAHEQVSATFFLSGHQAASETALVRRMFDEGHELGHDGLDTQPVEKVSDLRQALDVRSTTRVLEAVTGHTTLLHLSPSLSSPVNPVPMLAVSSEGPQGAVIIGAASQPSFAPAPTLVKDRNAYVFVVHDDGDSSALITALPKLINDLRARGYRFTTVSGLLGLQRDALMPRLSTAIDHAQAQANRMLLSMTNSGGKVLEWLFAAGAFLAMLRTVGIVVLAMLQNIKRRRRVGGVQPAPTGRVSIIIPGYNEMLSIVSVLEHALATEHADTEVIFVDDGSTDETYARAQAAFEGHPRVRLLRKANGGKASALNAGLRIATGEFVVCIDADTLMTPSTVGRLLAEFTSPNVAAVAGCIQIANPNNLLTRWQEVEYMIGQNLDRNALDLINGINTIPGALGAFRRQVIHEVGGYKGDTLAEDTDLTLRVLRSGYRVTFAPKAIARTEAPETVEMLLRQRFRWSYGAMQTLWKHRGAFAGRNRGLGMVTLPQVLIFQLLLPFLVPLADICLLFTLWSGSAWHVLIYGVAFLAVDLFAAVIALVMAGERLRLPYLTLMLLTQRAGYRYFVFIPLFKALLAAIHGRAVGWGHLQRLGRVAQSLPQALPQAAPMLADQA